MTSKGTWTLRFCEAFSLQVHKKTMIVATAAPFKHIHSVLVILSYKWKNLLSEKEPPVKLAMGLIG